MNSSQTLRISKISIRETFASLKHYNYRLWFAGQLISLVGTWMQATAQGYLVYSLTNSPVYLGYVGFAAGLPTWLFTLYGGVIADRVSRRTMMIFTQTAMMILAFLLAGLVFLHLIQPWEIIGLAFLLGVANAFDAPPRQAIVVDLVEREDLTNAIALNATMFNAAVVVGPAVAGITYAALGAGWCFTLNGLSFIAVLIALFFMKLKPVEKPTWQASTSLALKEGLEFVARHKLIRTLIINVGILSIFGLSMMTLLPAWSVSILGGDVTTNGILLSARGLGSLVGALMIASLIKYNIQGKIWTAGSFLLPVTILIFALVRSIPLATLIIIPAGWAFMVQANTSNALVQVQLPDALRGRVMSIYTLIFFGGMPIGALLAGVLANGIGEPWTLAISAIIMFAFASFVWFYIPAIRSSA